MVVARVPDVLGFAIMSTRPPLWLSRLLHAQPSTEGPLVGVLKTSALDLLASIPSASTDLVLTDPPYFIDKMGDDWNKEGLKKGQSKAGVVGSMPVGMKFDPRQGQRLQKELLPVFKECLRILKPGGFVVAFSQARLYHRMAMAAEDAGFEIRDMLGWTYESGQAKAFSQDHFIRKMAMGDQEKAELRESLGGRKTPQLKPMIEPMLFGQKPKEGTFVQNWQAHRVGLIDTGQRWEGKFPGNLIQCPKPSTAERGEGNNHLTVKPQGVLRHLIRLLTVPGAVVVDPYAGSSSTQWAALMTGRHAIGSEREKEDFETSRRRLAAAYRSLKVNPKGV